MDSSIASGLVDVPDHFPDDLFLRDGAKITAVCAVNLRPPHLESQAASQHLLYALDQGPVGRMAEDNHFPWLYFAYRKGKTRSQYIIARLEIREKTMAADFQKLQDQNLENGKDEIFTYRVR